MAHALPLLLLLESSKGLRGSPTARAPQPARADYYDPMYGKRVKGRPEEALPNFACMGAALVCLATALPSPARATWCAAVGAVAFVMAHRSQDGQVFLRS